VAVSRTPVTPAGSVDGRNQLIAKEDAQRIGVDQPVMAEGLIVAPHYAEVGLGEAVLPWRWISQVEVVTFDEPVHDPTFDQEMVEFVSNGALAHTGTTADQQEFCGLVNHPQLAPPWSFSVLK
jgi:hypothetical protein